MLWVLLIVLVLIVVLAVVGFFYFQLQGKKRGQISKSAHEDKSGWGICSRCGQHRLIVKKELKLCAFCWSSINTKQIA